MNSPARAAESTALATVAEPQPLRVAAPTGRDLILHADNLNAMVRVSELMANSGQAVPRHLRKNPGACFAVTSQAMRWNMDPFALAQKTYTTDNEAPLAYEGQAIIAALNNSPLLATRLAFEWGGPWEKIIGRFVWKESAKKTDDNGKPKKYLAKAWDDNEEQGLWCTVTATLAGESAPRQLQLFLMQARVRNSPLWVEDPRQQLAYLAGRRWGRLYAPDVIMGVYTPDELEALPRDMGDAEVVQPQVDAELLARAQQAAGKGRAAYQEFWKLCTHLDRAMLSEKSDWHEKLKQRAAEVDNHRTVDNAAAPAPTPAPGHAANPAPAAAAPGAAPEQQPAAGQFTATYANVMDRMLKAADKKDRDALDIAADWIGEVADPEQRKELAAKYDELKAQIEGGRK